MSGIRKPNSIKINDGLLSVDVGVRSFSDAKTVIDLPDRHHIETGNNRWRAARSGRGHTPYVVRKESGKWQSLHRLIVGVIPLGFVVDHINGNPLDNRRSNLRVVNHGDNARNCAATAGRALPKGVSVYRGRYRARLTFNRREIRLGVYDDPQDAAAAYEAAARHYFGAAVRSQPDRAAAIERIVAINAGGR